MENKIKFGISIYPETQNIDEVIDYIKLANKYGYSRIFTSLLQIDESKKEEQLSNFKKVFEIARELNYEIVLDVAPVVFDKLNIKLPDTKFFSDLGATTIRLDEGYDGYMEKEILDNNPDIDLEINMSTSINYIDKVKRQNTNLDRVKGSHNFYPQKYSGLDFDYFIESSKIHKEAGIRTQAFITSQSDNSKYGPWNVNEGLCSVEDHRDLPSLIQAQHLIATGYIDDISFGNSFASEEELEAVSSIKKDNIILEVELEENISNEERSLLLDYDNHFRRGDISPYFIRSTMGRVDYADHDFNNTHNHKKQEYGEVWILNNEFDRYKGEVQIILKDMPEDPKKNLVGKISKQSQILMPFIKSETKFSFKTK